MKIQNRLFEANPQAMAAGMKRRAYDGHPDLGASVDRDTWLTPRYILDQIGAFDLDPCAADAVPQWAAARYLTKRDNGLVQPWTGRVFMNPPFSDTPHWIEKTRRVWQRHQPVTGCERFERLAQVCLDQSARHPTAPWARSLLQPRRIGNNRAAAARGGAYCLDAG